LSPIREGKAYVAADINPAIWPSFEANGGVIPFPPRLPENRGPVQIRGDQQ